MKSFSKFIRENNDKNQEHHASVIPLTGFSPISHMGHAKDLGGAMKKLPGKKHIGISSKSDVYTPEERSKILHRQWKQPEIQHHFVKSAGETIAAAHKSLPEHGKKVLHLLVGHDRKEFAHGLKKSLEDGKIKEMGDYKWDEIHIHHPDDTDRSHGMSGKNMRKAASEGNLSEFHRHLGSDFSESEAKEHMKKFQNAQSIGTLKLKRPGGKSKLKENRAIFVCGGPGSGKDIVIRECINTNRSVEIDINYLTSILNDKYTLGENTTDIRKIAFQSRFPLVINCSADKFDLIQNVKEELEEFNYSSMMVFVDTTDRISKERNEQLKRSLVEDIRRDKWEKSQENKYRFFSIFEHYFIIKNNGDIDEIYMNAIFENIDSFLNENNAPVVQMLRKAGKKDSVKDGDVKSNSDYIFKTYESNQPRLLKVPPPRIPKFNQDNSIVKLKKNKYGNREVPGTVKAPGVGPTFDNRSAQGNIYPTSGLGNDVVYKEEYKYTKKLAEGISKKTFSDFRKKINEVAGTDPDAVMGSNMGVGGTLGGAMNKMPLQTPQNQLKNLGAFSDSKKRKGKK